MNCANLRGVSASTSSTTNSKQFVENQRADSAVDLVGPRAAA